MQFSVTTLHLARLIALITALITALTGCGTKGPLTLPPASKATAPTAAKPAPAATAPLPTDDNSRIGEGTQP